MVKSETSRRSRRLETTVLACVLGAGISAPAWGVDLVAAGVDIIQDLSLDDATLIAGRPVFVRLGVVIPGSTEDFPGVDGVMRVFVDGQESPESPIYSINGPFAVPSHAIAVEEDSKLNFIFIPPQSDDVDFLFEVNPPGLNHVDEEDLTNNTTEVVDVSFVCRRAPELVYVPIDYRPGGGNDPNLPDEEVIKPGIGDGFVRGIYPTWDWNYHRVAGLDLLWTQNVNSSESSLLNTLSSMRQNTIPDMGLPEPDYIYGWLEGNPCSCNGIAISTPGDAAFGNSELVRHQRTFAHELGHLFGMFHNSRMSDTVGVDVEHHLLDTEGLERMKSEDQWDIMVAGLLTHEAWIDQISSNFVTLRAVLQCSSGFTGDQMAPVLHVAGVVDTATGAVTLDPVMRLSVPKAPTPSISVGATVRIDAFTNPEPGAGPIHAVRVNTQTAVESCAAAGELRSTTALNVLIPAVGPGGLPVVKITATRLVDGAVVAEVMASPNSPEPSFIQPAANASIDGVLHVSWTGTDVDGDELQYNLLYSPNGDRFVPILVRSTLTDVEVPLDRLPASTSGGAILRLMATDGLNTTIVDRALSRVGTRGGMGARGGEPNSPEVHLITPNDDSEHRFGATVPLRAAAWDLEDLALDGDALVWISTLDGEIGTGRLTSVADLSVGTHSLKVTGTDQDGNSASSGSIEITILDRDLPDLAVCEGDANGDGLVDPLDSGFVLARFGCAVGTGDPNCDLADQNGDGLVDPLDSGFVLARFGDCQ